MLNGEEGKGFFGALGSALGSIPVVGKVKKAVKKENQKGQKETKESLKKSKEKAQEKVRQGLDKSQEA
ncbi:hypothetical protein ACZ11_04330 [Lysinibacillus xylanilyticus]|uniref:Uncharacterized protein n=1 Tax=Lysinibacillus xylanilyticus TaxID=582475 RepID=A0A0K9FB67_9BACI|nr:hypothetical protein [Lysinibacillus xylanilyticus]KMY31472.1 hypothetical protein ACZ11_04330 [Lysinibacillus xylanilyticus]